MQRHHEKRRDMARSILPARSRERARTDLAVTRRAHRRAVAQELRDLIGVADPAGDGKASYEEWDERHQVGRTADAEIRVLMGRRRGSDKVNHFIRWSIAVTAELPIEDRLPHLRRTLPDGLVGRHAMSHLQYEAELRPAQDHDRRYLEPRAGWAARQRARRQAQREAELDVIRGLMRAVLDTGGELARFNRVMKTCDLHLDGAACGAAGCVRRCLTGVHDIDTFVEEVAQLAPDQGRRWSVPEGPNGLPARRLAHWLTALRLASAIRVDPGPRPSSSSPAS